MRITAVVGNPKPLSRTLHAAQQVAVALAGKRPDETIDLADLGSEIHDASSARVADAKRHVLQSDLLVVASPTYKGSYTGLLKVFLDRFGRDELNGITAIPVMLGASHLHALAPELLLKPVLVEIGAICPTRALFLIDSKLDDPSELDQWAGICRRHLATSVGVLDELIRFG